ncbi:M18 family aminopeptidase [Actinomyces sp. oral taxon 175]|uniref:M18 family aminopeptidase n=1 Tax=Actinomyces sp. oral taxon 175 TaxID=712119 RepID=UPI00021D2B69|nr:M18 family aminopeptidase [Actinomyces sp. oral taxon 175]EGV12471.1 aminopeptidase I zinc metalloprotease [Actinomyces sp. oral taxon 175 str. F0384]
MTDAASAPTSTPTRDAAEILRDDDAYTDSLIDFVTASPSSYHAAAEVARRLEEAGFTRADETITWQEDLPRRGYVIRDGAIAAWALPETLNPGAGLRIVGAHTDSPALKLKPAAALVRSGWQLINAEVYGGPLLASFLDRELGLAGRLTTRDGAVHLVRTGPIARVSQIAPHLDRSVNDTLHLDRQTHLLPLWSLAAPDAAADAVETHLCEIAGIDPAELAGHDVLTYPTQAPARFGRRGEFLASSRLDNLSSVHAGLVALEALAAAGTEPAEPVILVAFDHEEVGSDTRSGAGGPFLETLLRRLARVLGVSGDRLEALLARSTCLSADAGHSVHPAYAHLHDPAVQPLINHGPLLKINAQQRYATDAAGAAIWARACTAAGVPSQDFVSNNAVPCGSTIGPITATRLGITTVDVGVPLLSMHSAREMGGVKDGPWLAQALHAYWQGA